MDGDDDNEGSGEDNCETAKGHTQEKRKRGRPQKEK